MKRKMTYGVVALVTMALLFVGGVSAFGGLGFGNGAALSDEEKADMQAFHDEVQSAIENNDYEAWANLMQSQVTVENFEKLQKRHQIMTEVKDIREQMREAREAGDTQTFEDLRAQLQELVPEGQGFGSRERGMKGFGMRGGMGQGFGGYDGECPYADSE